MRQSTTGKPWRQKMPIHIDITEVEFHFIAERITWLQDNTLYEFKGTLEEAREIALDMGRTVRVYHMKGEYLGIRA